MPFFGQWTDRWQDTWWRSCITQNTDYDGGQKHLTEGKAKLMQTANTHRPNNSHANTGHKREGIITLLQNDPNTKFHAQGIMRANYLQPRHSHQHTEALHYPCTLQFCSSVLTLCLANFLLRIWIATFGTHLGAYSHETVLPLSLLPQNRLISVSWAASTGWCCSSGSSALHWHISVPRLFGQAVGFPTQWSEEHTNSQAWLWATGGNAGVSFWRSRDAVSMRDQSEL